MNSRLASYDPWKDGCTRRKILTFASVGIYPPPLGANLSKPEVIIFGLASQERFNDPPPLSGTDEEGVEQQMRDFTEAVDRGLALVENRNVAEFGIYYAKHRYPDNPLWRAHRRALLACEDASTFEEYVEAWEEARRLQELLDQERSNTTKAEESDE